MRRPAVGSGSMEYASGGGQQGKVAKRPAAGGRETEAGRHTSAGSMKQKA